MINKITALAATLMLALVGSSTAHAATMPNTASERVTVPDTKPAWATTETIAGPVDGTHPVTVRMYWAGRDPAGLAAYALAVSNPVSPDFQHYLSAAQFQNRYGPTAAQRNVVDRWLTSAHLRVTEENSHYAAAAGAVADINKALGIHLNRYRTHDGLRQAPDADISLPASVAPSVLAVTGLAAEPTTTTDSTSSAPATENTTCSRYYAQKQATTLPPAYGHPLPYTVCGYEPNQIRSAYGVDHSALTGRGVTVAVVVRGSSPTIASDTNTFFQRHDLPAFQPGQLTQNLPSDITSCPAGRHWGEETLDIESVHTMATDAKIVYVAAGCATTESTEELDAETRIVDQQLASIVNNSWGSTGTEAQTSPDMATVWDRVFQQGAIEGIGFYFASGDQGDDATISPDHQPAVEFPQSDPWVTTVGGTSLAIDAQGGYQWETGWGAMNARLSADGKNWTGLPGTFDSGAGGGTSIRFTQPYYQRGIVPDDLSRPHRSGPMMRVIPDVALDADEYTGMLMGMTSTATPFEYQESPDGGTSMSAPLFAGIQADAQQAQQGIPIGFANPAIYARYDTVAYHDVTDHPLGPKVSIANVDSVTMPDGTTRNSAITFGLDSSLRATPGYDDVTGVGTPSEAYPNSYQKGPPNEAHHPALMGSIS